MKKLLIVDDSIDLVYAMQKLLAFYQYSIRTAKDSKTLIKELESFEPDIISIDVMLAGEDGKEICKILRQNPANNKITIILFSSSPRHLENFKEYGADGAIEKPFGITDLINQIKFSELNRKANTFKNRPAD
jgi:Response regulators consisting of a CheY-like receiver domain and a winged-helix DNA-binding domain